jgi:outer membrane protein
MKRVGSFFALVLLGISAVDGLNVAAATNKTPIALSLENAILTALQNNRDLQVERFNPTIARATLSSSYGWYDPLLISDARHESDVETGGFDPANFSADAVYTAHSRIGNANLFGLLPSGMSYTLTATYANAYGERNSLDFDSYRVFAGAALRQPLLRNMWIDPGRYAIRINKRNVRWSEHGVRFIANNVINQVQQAYYELAYAYEEKRIQDELVRTRAEMLSGMQRRMDEGMATEPDVQLAKAQLAAAQTALNASSASVALAENMLRTAIGDNFTNQITSTIHPTDYLLLVPAGFHLQDTWNAGLKHRPDLAQFRVDVEKSDIDVRLRRNQLFPSLDIIASYGRRGSSTAEDVPPFKPSASLSDAISQVSGGDAPREMFGLALTVPLSRQYDRGMYKAAKLLRAQNQIRLKQKEELIMREVSDAFHSAQTAYDRAKTARVGVEASTAAYAAEQKRLTGGTSSIFFVLQVQNDLFSARLLEARARADYNKALAQLRFAEGTSLERYGVEMADVPLSPEKSK